MNRTIILPYTPAPLKKFLENQKVFLEKISKGEEIDENLRASLGFGILPHLKEKYKRKV